MTNFLTISQIVISVLLIITILSQDKGSGLSATFGGGGEVYRSRRGIDRILLYVTVALAVLFVLNSIAFLFFEDSVVTTPVAGDTPQVDVTSVETTETETSQ